MTIAVAALVGPTAVGKSEIAMTLAERLDAEIVSADSMQVYRGMDIGTDKPSREMRARIRHHMLDLFPPSHELSVVEFRDLARAAIADVAGRGKLPLLVGGSGLYVRAIVDDLTFPPTDPGTRAALEREVDRVGAEAMHARLAKADPGAAEHIPATNVRRIVRALEAIEIGGEPFSANRSWGYESIYNLVLAGLTRSRAELGRRIARRVEVMLERGLVQEAKTLERVGLSRTARQALGYRQVLEGTDDLAATIVIATRRFARRQESWFRADPRISWFQASDDGVVGAVERYYRDVLGRSGGDPATGTVDR